MPDEKSLKRFLITGAIVGGILAITITLLMDVFFAESLNGTWRDAIVSDLHNFFKITVTISSPIVFVVFGIILIVLSGFGAVMGMIFTFFIIKFFSFLKS